MMQQTGDEGKEKHGHNTFAELIAEETRKMGIPYVEAEIQALNAEADRVGAPHLQVMHPP